MLTAMLILLLENNGRTANTIRFQIGSAEARKVQAYVDQLRAYPVPSISLILNQDINSVGIYAHSEVGGTHDLVAGLEGDEVTAFLQFIKSL